MYLILAALILCAGYLAILFAERVRGARYLERERARLDRAVVQARFIVRHVDFASFVREELVRLARAAAHQAAAWLLAAVRSLEALLSRIVRRLRLHPEGAPAPSGESARHFVRTLSAFKVELEATRPKPTSVR